MFETHRWRSMDGPRTTWTLDIITSRYRLPSVSANQCVHNMICSDGTVGCESGRLVAHRQLNFQCRPISLSALRPWSGECYSGLFGSDEDGKVLGEAVHCTGAALSAVTYGGTRDTM